MHPCKVFLCKDRILFAIRITGGAYRIDAVPECMTREESFDYFQNHEPEELFDVKKTTIPLPAEAKNFESYVCECCGERTGANWIRIMDGKKVCLDCYGTYDRFNA